MADYTNLANLSQSQSGQALAFGDQAARYADPFMQERGKYQKQLSDLMANPGAFASSPAYKFAYDQGLEALNRKGGVRSGAKLAALQNYGQGAASQQYFNQAKLLSDLAMSGASPAAAGLAYEKGTARSQDYAQMAAAARASGNINRGGGGGGYGGDILSGALARHDAQLAQNRQNFGYGGGYGDTSYGNGYGSGYNYGGLTGDGSYGNTYFPSSLAGTGSITSDYGTYDFGTPARGDSYYTPSSYSGNSWSDYYSGDGGLSDYGYGDYGDYGGDYGYYDDYGY